MNRSIIFVFVCVALLSSVVFAQTDSTIKGAVSFKKAVVEEKKSASEEPKTILNDAGYDQAKLLARVTARTDIWDNPRFVKIYYERMKGMQRAIDRVQQAELDKQSYPNKEAKEKAKEKLQSEALMHFKDYQDKPEDVQKRINQNPREAVLDMFSRISFIDEKQMEPERSKAFKAALNQNFYDSEGLTAEEYMSAMEQQNEAELQQGLSETEKAQQFPVLKSDRKVDIEKVDEQNALLRVSVGAPRSKKE